MSTFTAQILVGRTNPLCGGIANVSHSLFLSENTQHAWILQGYEFSKDKIIWIPTEDGMLEDALVMTCLYVLKDKEITRLATIYLDHKNENFVDLNQDISPENLQKLYHRARQIQSNMKFIVNVFAGSIIQQQLDILKDYDFDLEVCQTVYRKEYSEVTQKREEFGLLDSVIW